MKKTIFLFLITSIITIGMCILSTCKNDKAAPDYNYYPNDIGKIIFTKCAVSGCHNDASKGAAGGLSLASWDKLFEGGDGSACVIPYRSDFSTLLYYTNTYSDLGIILAPTMPYNKDRLSREEVLLLKKWIDAGAPNREGFVKFSDDPNRKKFYVTNQACDEVAVFDMATLLPMRYIHVGNSAATELPHNIKISPDGKYWYVILSGGNSLQKYRTSDDAFVGEAIYGIKNWNTVTISNDGNTAYTVDWESSGDIAIVDLNALSTPPTHNYGLFNYPHGSCLNPAGDTLYVTQNNSSNKLYKIPVNDFSSSGQIPLFTTTPSHTLDTHEVLFSTDGTKYFVTCQGTSEVRIFQQGTDQLLKTIPVGALPSEMAVTKNYLFVTCEEDTLSFPGKRGSIAVIDLSDFSLKPPIYSGHQPHGIGVDDTKNMVFVANRNQTTGGPAPHHSGACGGRNGYITFIDINTLELVPYRTGVKKVEVSVDPYSIAVRH